MNQRAIQFNFLLLQLLNYLLSLAYTVYYLLLSLFKPTNQFVLSTAVLIFLLLLFVELPFHEPDLLNLLVTYPPSSSYRCVTKYCKYLFLLPFYLLPTSSANVLTLHSALTLINIALTLSVQCLPDPTGCW